MNATLHHYKNPPKSSQTKVRIIYPSFGTLVLWKFSNLTFGGYFAGTTPVISWDLLFLCCVGVVLSMWGLCDLLTIFGIINFHVISPPILIVFKAICRDANAISISKENKQSYHPNSKQFIMKRCWLHLAKSVGYQVCRQSISYPNPWRCHVWFRGSNEPWAGNLFIYFFIYIIFLFDPSKIKI